MDIFFYIKGRIFETLSQAQNFRKLNCPSGKIEEIYTSRKFEHFEACFNYYKENGESDADAIELSR